MHEVLEFLVGLETRHKERQNNILKIIERLRKAVNITQAQLDELNQKVATAQADQAAANTAVLASVQTVADEVAAAGTPVDLTNTMAGIDAIDAAATGLVGQVNAIAGTVAPAPPAAEPPPA